MISHQITVQQCETRRRQHFHKCPICVHQELVPVLRDSQRYRRVHELPNEASDDDVAVASGEAVTLAEALYRTHGGHGLVLDSLQAEQPAAEEVSA